MMLGRILGAPPNPGLNAETHIAAVMIRKAFINCRNEELELAPNPAAAN
jgi:hypothetical protein